MNPDHYDPRKIRLVLALLLAGALLLGVWALAGQHALKNSTNLSEVNRSPGDIPVQETVITGTPVFTATSELTGSPTLSDTEIPAVILTGGLTTAPTPTSTYSTSGSVVSHPAMYLSPEELSEQQKDMESGPTYSAPQQFLLQSTNLPTTSSKSLISYVPYTDSDRDQGYCGNCWVWASTGALEVEHNVKSGVNNRLSIQYFNSKYNSGTGSSYACCGGTVSQFASWYNTDQTPIPWANTNAGYGDYYSNSCPGTTAVPISSISTTPNYKLNSLTYSWVTTSSVSRSQAIANIKSALDNNKAVIYSFYFSSNEWTAFQNFWAHSSSSDIWDPTSYEGQAYYGGHAVLIVGYDDTDPSHPYWIVLNSGVHRQTGLTASSG